MANYISDRVPLVKIRRVSTQAVFPTRGSSGYILSSARTTTIKPLAGFVEVPTDLTFTVPSGLCFGTVPIPGVSWQDTIRVVEKFIGPCPTSHELVSVMLSNTSRTGIEIKAGEPIAQLKTYGCFTVAPEFVEVATQFD